MKSFFSPERARIFLISLIFSMPVSTKQTNFQTILHPFLQWKSSPRTCFQNPTVLSIRWTYFRRSYLCALTRNVPRDSIADLFTVVIRERERVIDRVKCTLITKRAVHAPVAARTGTTKRLDLGKNCLSYLFGVFSFNICSHSSCSEKIHPLCFLISFYWMNLERSSCIFENSVSRKSHLRISTLLREDVPWFFMKKRVCILFWK